MDRLFTVEEVAAYIKVTEYTVRTWLKKRQMVGTKVGKDWRITESEVKRFTNQLVHPKSA